MCTAISVTSKHHYFGRNLDYEHGFGEKIVITPRRYPFLFRNGTVLDDHYAIIGMALPVDGYPLYFDATNEKGLSIAGLNFPVNAVYRKPSCTQDNVASFELIPWILSQCKTVADAEKLFEAMCITDEAFNEALKPSPLHWFCADGQRSITVEQTREGLRIFENPAGVLTNNPPFAMQMMHLTDFLSVMPSEPKNRFSEKLDLEPYSRGMGGIGLPGDLSSASRFVKACFLKLNSIYGDTEQQRVNSFFHVLYGVYQQHGCVQVGQDFERTHYTSCCNTDTGVYYYTTYHNSNICAVDLHQENLDQQDIMVYPLVCEQKIAVQNKKRK